MSGFFNKMIINKKEFQYDLDPDIIFNYTSDHVQYMYTTESIEQEEKEEVETIYAANLISSKDLKIKFVLKCRNQTRLPILVIIAVDMLKQNYIFCYNVAEQQLTQAATKKTIECKVTQASITQDPIKVAFMGSQMSDSETCYALVLGTENGTATLILLKIEEPIFEASLLSIEPMVSEQEGAPLGSVTAIHILHSGDGDKRMGHADPQIALGFSRGSILIYRFRANVYVSKASRFRPPVDLSEYTEFRDYPIKCISCTRSYNSLAITVAFVQEKPHNVEKYQYSDTYVKVVEIHGNLTHKQRKIINPGKPHADVMDAELLASSLKTVELDNIIQLSILYEGVDTFGLNIWHISPNNVHEELNINLPTQSLLNKLLYRRKLRSDNCIGFYKHTPQKLVQRMLQDYSRPVEDQHEKAQKRRMETDHGDAGVKKRGRKKKVALEGDTSEFERESSTASALEDIQMTKDVEKGKALDTVKPTEESEAAAEQEKLDDSKPVESEDVGETTIIETQDEPNVPNESSFDVTETFDEPSLIETEELDESTLVDTEQLDESICTKPGEWIVKDAVDRETAVEEVEEAVETKVPATTTDTQPALTIDSGTQNKEIPFSPTYEDLLASVTNVPTLSENDLEILGSTNHSSAPSPSEPNESKGNDNEQPKEDASEKEQVTGTNISPQAEAEAQEGFVQVTAVETSIEIVTKSEIVEEEVKEEKVEERDTMNDPEPTKKVKELVGEIEKRIEESKNDQTAFKSKEANSTNESNDISDDYVIIKSEDVPPSENLVENDDDEEEQPGVPEDEATEEDDGEVTAMDVDDIIAASAANNEHESEGAEADDLNDNECDEEMYDGPDYDDDTFSLGEIEEKSIPNDDECILLSSGGEEEAGDVEENDVVAATDEDDSFMTDSVSEVGSLQQSFVPASSTPQDTPPPQANHHPTVDYVPVTQQDLLRLLQSTTDNISHHLAATRESTVDSGSGYTPDPYTEYSTENTQTPTSDGEALKGFESAATQDEDSTFNKEIEDSTDYIATPTDEFTDSLQSPADDTSDKDTDDLADRVDTESEASNDEFSECIEMEVDTEEQERKAAEIQRQRDMERTRLLAQNDFSNMLYDIFGDESIDHFMERPSIPQGKLDEIGSSCWFNPNPHMKLLLLRYCNRHNLEREVISLCRLLTNTPNDFTKEENLEYKNIYLKYLRDYPSYHHGEVVNIFHAEGRQQLIEREMDYYKSKEPVIDADEERKKQRQSYMKYYGFGLRY